MSGRITHELLAGFWSTAVTVEFARIWRDKPKFVFSRVVPGQGRPLFQAPDVRMNLKLDGTWTFGNGFVLLCHQPQ
ncbi:hypothetical protein RKD54_002014 [Pseudarthrobacter sp. SLBN-100]|uniref:hypothetical protein n=1 Tax=Arthrobacter sp. SLBN-100 TaxID=2768450 RepID=UPI001F38BFE5|nr:hypothetical protein [Arthrobacter sp. SLBN-100]